MTISLNYWNTEPHGTLLKCLLSRGRLKTNKVWGEMPHNCPHSLVSQIQVLKNECSNKKKVRMIHEAKIYGLDQGSFRDLFAHHVMTSKVSRLELIIPVVPHKAVGEVSQIGNL